MAQIETKEYFNCSRAAEALGLSADSVRQYCNNALKGKTPALQALQIGREWLIHKTEISRYKKERNGRGRPNSNGKS